jgi:hypothetical protein
VSNAKYLIVELRQKNIFVVLMQSDYDQYILRKLPTEPHLMVLRQPATVN